MFVFRLRGPASLIPGASYEGPRAAVSDPQAPFGAPSRVSESGLRVLLSVVVRSAWRSEDGVGGKEGRIKDSS